MLFNDMVFPPFDIEKYITNGPAYKEYACAGEQISASNFKDFFVKKTGKTRILFLLS